MEIVTPCSGEWTKFLRLAALEGWRVPESELRLLEGELAGSAFVLRSRGEFCGFVTAVAHGHSGWVGNLLVPGECRGRGYGSLLFEHALRVLERKGVASIWLTASEAGRPIYEKRGFQSLNRVRRWRYRAEDREIASPGSVIPTAELIRADSLVWGEFRSSLLEPLAESGWVFSVDGNWGVLQPGERFQVLGPWVSPQRCPRGNRRLLAAMLDRIPAGMEVVTDVLETAGMGSLLIAAGFEPQGSCDLMARGEVDRVHLGALVSLASLGSIG